MRACLCAAGLFVTLAFSAHASVTAPVPLNPKATKTDPTADTCALSAKQAAIPLIAAVMATSDMPHLRTALTEGPDAGLTVSEAKEILVHLNARVCEQLSISRSGLHRRLQKETTNFQSILADVRLAEARVLLEQSRMALSDISDRLGFSSPSAFSRFFSVHCGSSPSEYRRRRCVA